MKLTFNNYGEQWDNVKSQLPSYLVDNSEGYLEFADIIDAADEEMKQDVQDFLDKCNKFLSDDVPDKKTPKEKKPRKPREPKAPKEPKQPKAPKPKKEKPKKEPKVFEGEYVENLSVELKIIDRFRKLHGKTVCVTTKDEARKILAALQKAAVDKVIRKTSKYAKEIMDIQDSLIKILKLTKGEVGIQGIEHYREICKQYKVMDATALIRSFIAIQGKEGVKAKAKNLHEKFKAYIEKVKQAGGWENVKDGKYADAVMTIENSLFRYITDKDDVIEISERELNGLYGLAGINCKPKKGQAIGSREFLGAHFDTLPFSGKWRRLIGMPESHFKIMIYGKAGSGKSTLALQFAKYLAELGKKVLYVADEEKFGYTLQEKIKRLNAAHENLSIVDNISADPSKMSKADEKILLAPFDIIVLDSVNSMGLDAEQLRDFAPSKSFVYVFQTTKDGKFRGENTFEHDVDVVVHVEDMQASCDKNRFGGKDCINVL